jgi:hypothetical protein
MFQALAPRRESVRSERLLTRSGASAKIPVNLTLDALPGDTGVALASSHTEARTKL